MLILIKHNTFLDRSILFLNDVVITVTLNSVVTCKAVKSLALESKKLPHNVRPDFTKQSSKSSVPL